MVGVKIAEERRRTDCDPRSRVTCGYGNYSRGDGVTGGQEKITFVLCKMAWLVQLLTYLHPRQRIWGPSRQDSAGQ